MVANTTILYLIIGALFAVLSFIAFHAVERARGETVSPVANPYLFIPAWVIVTFVATALLGWSQVLLAGVLSSGILIGFVHPIFAASFFVANLLIRPWELLPANLLLTALPRFLAATSLLSWALYRIRSGDLTIKWSLPCFLFIGLVVSLTVSALLSIDPSESLHYLSTNFIPIVVVSFIVLNSSADKLSVQTFRGSMAISITATVLISIFATVQKHGSFNSTARLEGIGLWSNANDVAALIAFALPLVIVPWILRGKSTLRIFAGLSCAMILFFGLWISQSRGAILALGVGVLITILALNPMNLKTIASILVAILAPLLLYFGISREEVDLNTSSSLRLNYLITGLRMLRTNPLFGVGPGNYPVLFEHYTNVFEEWGERTAHSTWILALSEGGVVAFVLILALFAVVLRRAWKVRREMPELLFTMLAYGVAITFLSHTYMAPLYLLLALVVGAEHTARRTPRPFPLFVPRIAIVLFALSITTPVAAQSEFTIEATSSGNKPLGEFIPTMSNSLHIKGSRGEVRNFILRVGGGGCDKLQSSKLTSSNGSSTDFRINLYAMRAISTEHPSFPGAFVGAIFDPLIPLPTKEICAGNSGKTWIWGEIILPLHATPGDYRGTLQISGATLPLHITVWKMQIPDRSALPAYSELTTWFNLLGHYGKWHEGEALLADKYSQEMVAHRIIPVKSAISLPQVQLQDGKPALNLTSSPDTAQSFNAVTLKNRPTWAYYDFPTVQPELIAAPRTVEYLTAVENSISSIARPGKPFFYLWDEPQPEALLQLENLARLAKRYSPSVKVMVTTPWSTRFDSLIDIFCPVMDAFGPSGDERASTYHAIQRRGKEFWWYISCMSHGCEALANPGTPDMVIDRPSVYIRAIPWISARYGVDAFLYYSVNNGYQFYPKRDPWRSLWDFSGNGDGTLFYPGRPGENGQTQHGPIPSIRIKSWREASYDSEYIRWISTLDHKPDWYLQEDQALVSSVSEWSRDYDRYEALRIKIGEYLNNLP